MTAAADAHSGILGTCGCCLWLLMLAYSYDLLLEHNPSGFHLRDTYCVPIIHLKDKSICEVRKHVINLPEQISWID